MISNIHRLNNIVTPQIVECNALPTLILMLRSEDTAIHYEAVRSQRIYFCYELLEFPWCWDLVFAPHVIRITLVFYESQVGVIGNLVHSSPNIKKEVLLAGALQPVIGLLRYVLTLGSCHYCGSSSLV